MIIGNVIGGKSAILRGYTQQVENEETVYATPMEEETVVEEEPAVMLLSASETETTAETTDSEPIAVSNIIGGNPITPKSCVFYTPDGKEIPAILVGEETIFTATHNDIREGKTAGTEAGVTTGTKVIPPYHTNQGVRIIPVGSEFRIISLVDLDAYDYTNLQAIICDFNTSLDDSVSANKVVIDDYVYAVQSAASLSVLVKNTTDKSVDFGIINDTDSPQVLRFFTYKEVE